MKVTVNTPKPAVAGVTIELDGEERVKLARVLYTLDWSSLPAEFDNFVVNLHYEVTTALRSATGYTSPIPGAEVYSQ